jgi:DNA ligase D-like protein (predicted 3'-phosphoesterase)
MTSNKKLIFVVHEHFASHHHFDFRIEKDGVLKSWAVPKNIEETENRKILAIQVDDHDYSYKNFEGIIEEGQYGAGTVKIWDNGTYEPIEFTDKKIVIKINGRKLKGTYILVKFKPPNNWLFFKKKE